MSHSWLRTDISANRYVDTYFKGFVDISGGDLYLRHGQMGIGTTNPGTALEISSSSGLRLTNTETKSNANDRIGYIDFENGGTGAAIESCVNEDGDNNADLRFMTTRDYNNTYVERMRIDRHGNVGIGTTTPQTKLQIGDITYIRNDDATYGTNDAVTIVVPKNSNNSVLNDPQDALILVRPGANGESWQQQAHLRISRYENSRTSARTRLDFALLHDSGGQNHQGGAAPDNIMTMHSNGLVHIGHNNSNTFQVGEWAPFGGIYVIAGGNNTDTSRTSYGTGITVNDPSVNWFRGGIDPNRGNLEVNANFVPNTYVKITMRAKSSTKSTYFHFENPGWNSLYSTRYYHGDNQGFAADDTFETIVFYVTIPSSGTQAGYLNIYGPDITITQFDIERQSTQAFKFIAGSDNTASLNDVNLNNAHLIIQSNASGSTDVDEIAFRSINNLADARIGYKQRIAFYGKREHVDRAHEVAAIECLYDSTALAYSSSHLIFKTHPRTGQESFERMRIDASGNVGIGTTTPGYKLDVSGNVSAQRGTNGHVSYFGNVAIGDLGFDDHAGIAFHRSTTYDTSFALLQSIGGETILNSSAGQSMYFQVGNATKMTMTSGGNVGIGTVTPGSAYKLDVNGTIHGTSLNINSNFTVDSTGIISASSLYTATLNNGADLSLPTTGGTLALTSDLHSAVSLSNTNYLSLSGQQITGGTIPVGSGGTNITSYAAGDILYATGPTTLTKLSKGANNTVLQVDSVGNLQYGTVTNAMLAGSITNGKLDNSTISIAGNPIALGGSIAASTIASAIQSHITDVGELNGLDVSGPVHLYPNGGSEGGEITLAYPGISSSSSPQNRWHIDVDSSSRFRIFRCEGTGSGACVNAINISTNGNIGIGGDPDSGGSKLKMYGQVDMNNQFLVNAYSLSSQFGSFSHSVTSQYFLYSSDVFLESTNGGAYIVGGNNIIFRTLVSDGSQKVVKNRMIIQNDGSVGIGTDTPASGNKLQVEGSVSAQRGTDGHVSYFGNMAIGNVGHSNHAGISFHSNLSTPNPSKHYALIQSSGGQTYLNSSSGQSITFQVDNTTVMNLDHQGNLGIGTTTPTYPLEVAKVFYAGSPGNYAFFIYNSTATPYTDVTSHDRNVSIFAHHSIWTADYIISSSDQRIKTNILDIQDDAALQTLRSIQPKTYNYKDVVSKGNSTVYGFIAQQIKEVLPDAVSTESSSIPNIYENTEVSTANGIYNTISFTNFDTADLDASSNVIVVKDLQNKDHTVTITEVIDNKTIRVDTDLSEWMGAVDASNQTVIPNEVQTYSQVIMDASNNVVLENYDITPIASMDASENVVGKMADLTGDNTIDSSGNYVDASGNTIAAINADGHYIDASGNYFDTDGNFKDASGSLIGIYKAEWKNVIINGTKIFVYGQKVDDFHTLNKSAVFTVATAALQEVDRQLQAEKAKVVTLESQMADLLARVTALESA